MSVQYDPLRAKFVVRWREDGRQPRRSDATSCSPEPSGGQQFCAGDMSRSCSPAPSRARS
jgi:hypothetical protein